VQTFVTQWDNALLREAFQRELARGGQVYFLHNEVESIQPHGARAGRAGAGGAHPHRPRADAERELEQVMLDFHRQRFNVLLCTTIIESGIDMPSANTIIIHRADKFGLSQLHQLRGRVGRSHHRAYAYLVTPDRKAMTADAEKRLEAIASLDELGAGFTLATHDLEIRGAGELLGEGQSGQMAEVGFSLYTELLERAVRSDQAGKMPDLDAWTRHGADVELHVPALIPGRLPARRAHAPDAVQAHQHAPATRSAARTAGRDDRSLRPAAARRSAVRGRRTQARRRPLGIRKLDLGATGGRIHFRAKPNVDPVVPDHLLVSTYR
jgi:transcription-repair coupling factor (superfamily II helicase)